MPAYNQKITRPMEFAEFEQRIENAQVLYRGKERPLSAMQKCFLSVLFLSGCRVSEALALTSADINYTNDTIYTEFFRLKGSKQTDPYPLPYSSTLAYMCTQSGRLFPFSRLTAWRLVKKVFIILYPHYFRMNRVTKMLERHGVVTTKNALGLSVSAIEHYVAKIDIKNVGISLREELSG